MTHKVRRIVGERKGKSKLRGKDWMSRLEVELTKMGRVGQGWQSRGRGRKDPTRRVRVEDDRCGRPNFEGKAESSRGTPGRTTT